MGFTRKIQYFLVHTLKYSNKEAKQLISNGAVCVNNTPISQNIELAAHDEIKVNSEIVKAHQPFIYIAYHKPVGLVSSLNVNVPDSLHYTFKSHHPIYIAGRLDKYSEGLMLLSNNGKWVKTITDPDNLKEKEYVVKVNKDIDDKFIEQMAAGVNIGFYETKPCKCAKIDHNSFNIVLTEGKNKQIKRMCKALKYQVIQLKRVRIESVLLDELKPGEYKLLNL